MTWSERRGGAMSYLIGGVLAGVAGLLTFLVIHHFWILPIWFIMPAGLVVAAAGGLAIGWSYSELVTNLPPRPLTSLALFGLVAAILAPSIILAELRRPLLDANMIATATVNLAETIPRFIIELPFTAAAIGAVAGWLIVHTSRAAISTALAGVVYALGPGHNIPLLGGTPAAPKGTVLLIAITAVVVIVLVEASAWLTRKRP